MSEAKHTLGPWLSVPSSAGIFGPDKAMVASVGSEEIVSHQRRMLGSQRSASEATANARLIAAAPDLLEACKAFVESWERSLQLEKTDIALRLAKDAIAKAKGK